MTRSEFADFYMLEAIWALRTGESLAPIKKRMAQVGRMSRAEIAQIIRRARAAA